jgi:hypothetical protein
MGGAIACVIRPKSSHTVIATAGSYQETILLGAPPKDPVHHRRYSSRLWGDPVLRSSRTSKFEYTKVVIVGSRDFSGKFQGLNS